MGSERSAGIIVYSHMDSGHTILLRLQSTHSLPKASSVYYESRPTPQDYSLQFDRQANMASCSPSTHRCHQFVQYWAPSITSMLHQQFAVRPPLSNRDTGTRLLVSKFNQLLSTLTDHGTITPIPRRGTFARRRSLVTSLAFRCRARETYVAS